LGVPPQKKAAAGFARLHFVPVLRTVAALHLSNP